MRLLVEEDYGAIGRRGAELVAKSLREKPDLAIMAATGDTPMGIYRELANMCAADELDTRTLRIIQLDDYLGIGPEDERSLYRWMKESLLDPLDIKEERVTRLPGDASDPTAACAEFDAKIAEIGGIDLAILGLGSNGHLGFNEPPSKPDADTRVVELAQASLESNAAYWGDRERVPRHAITAGMKQLLKARQILLVVSGARKSEILRRALEEAPSPQVPGSFIQTHPHAIVLADRGAAAGLRMAHV